MSGFVYLVGAGPGDPRLLTLRALELIQSAEIVAYDELVSREILALVSSSAELLPVGRRAGHGPSTYRLHPAVLECAHAGRNVVRLKGGDPFIFGRGGEEAEELAEAGIPFEIVPGVSAALGASAYCGIPLTHRLYSSGVTFSTGHDADRLDGQRMETVVVFMAGRRLAENVQRLVAGGRPASTPAAYIASATTANQRVIVATLADLVRKTSDVDPTAPALLVVGDVVSLRERLAWFELRPLAARRLLLARARPGRSEIAARLRALGAEVVEAPRVEVAELEDTSSLEAVLARIDEFHAVVFACATGIEAVLRRRSLAGVRIAAIGDEAASTLTRRGLEAAICLPRPFPEARAADASLLHGGPVLLITAEGAWPTIEGELAHLGVKVKTLPAYRHVHYLGPLALAPIDAVVLPNAAAARLLLTSEIGSQLREVPMMAIGPRTAECASSYGARWVTAARSDGIDGLLDWVVSELTHTGKPNEGSPVAGAEAR